jgi:glycosyltransferase involved in cell wall biosynthesis
MRKLGILAKVDTAMVSVQPLISVITVVRNAERHMSECLANVAAQNGVSLEHLVFDGLSSDRTVEILRKEAGPHVRWFNEADSGIYDAMNKAVQRAEGQWLLFLGVDDRLRQGSLARMAERLSDPSTVYYGDAWMMSRKRRYDGRFSTFRLARKNLCQQAVLYPRKVFEFHQFSLHYPIQADWVFNMHCWKDKRFRFEYVPEIITDYNDFEGISSRCRDLSIEQGYVQLLRENFPFSIAWPWIGVVIAGRIIKRTFPRLFRQNTSTPCMGGSG